MVTLRSATLAAVCILLPQVFGAVVGFLTLGGILNWYATLNKPWFMPLDYLFGPVWTVLYILMGISLYLVVSQGWEKKPVKTVVLLFALPFVANLVWSVLFFGLQSPLASLTDIFLLLLPIVATIVAFYRVSKPAAVLLVPYLARFCIAFDSGKANTAVTCDPWLPPHPISAFAGSLVPRKF